MSTNTPVHRVNKKRLSNLPREIKRKNIEELFDLFDLELRNIQIDYRIEARQIEFLLDIKRLLYIKVRNKTI